MNTTLTTLQLPSLDVLADLGQLVDEHGLGPTLPQVRALVRTARGLGVSPVLCQVALDPSAPVAVRERAVGRLIRRVAAVVDLAQHESMPVPA